MRTVTVDLAPDAFAAVVVEPDLAPSLGGEDREPTSDEGANSVTSTLSGPPRDAPSGSPFDRLLDFLGSIKLTDLPTSDRPRGGASLDGRHVS